MGAGERRKDARFGLWPSTGRIFLVFVSHPGPGFALVAGGGIVYARVDTWKCLRPAWTPDEFTVLETYPATLEHLGP